MKTFTNYHLLFLLSLTCLLVSINNGYAQDQELRLADQPKNILKIELASINNSFNQLGIFSSLNYTIPPMVLNYEQILNPRLSLEFGLMYISGHHDARQIPKKGKSSEAFHDRKTFGVISNQTVPYFIETSYQYNLGGPNHRFSLEFGPRLYLFSPKANSTKHGKGFYFKPKALIQIGRIDFNNITYISNREVSEVSEYIYPDNYIPASSTIVMSGILHEEYIIEKEKKIAYNLGATIHLGYQFFIKDRISIDFYLHEGLQWFSSKAQMETWQQETINTIDKKDYSARVTGVGLSLGFPF